MPFSTASHFCKGEINISLKPPTGQQDERGSSVISVAKLGHVTPGSRKAVWEKEYLGFSALGGGSGQARKSLATAAA